MKKVYWTMKNGEKVDIDNMSTNHLKNTLKMIVTNCERLKNQKEVKRREDILNGEIANQMYEQMIIEEFGNEEEWEIFNSGL